MIDPTISLAFAMHSNRGVFALLLGSGLSRSAGILTGWEIVLDLIRKVALLMGDDCEPAPEEWYKKKFGEDAEYARLLGKIAKSAAERQQLLRSYFEPNDHDLEQGLKVPTPAHHAIAELASRDYVRIILTTNFDRLLEKAMEGVGLSPTVISSTDHIHGALPLTHSRCTIIKVNGDYLDTRIKNTPPELASYDKSLNDLLDRVFDEYGLVVAGWSALWDTALRAAIERCPNHRFTTFWAAKGKVEEEARGLLERRRAVLLDIEGADSFFQSLSEKVISPDQVGHSHPLSAPIAVATLKRYLSEDRHRIRARDLVLDEAKRLHAQLGPEQFPVNIDKGSLDDLIVRMKRYQALAETLQSLFITGGYWGGSEHEAVWSDCLGLITDRQARSGITSYVNLQDYPTLLLMYSGGMAAIAGHKYGNLAAMLIRSTGHNPNHLREEPLAYLLNPDVVVSPEAAQKILNPGRKNYTPVSDYLALILREPFRDLLPREAQFDACFDRFEYFWTLLHIDLRTHFKTSSPWVIGRFLWRDEKHYDFRETVLEQLYREIDDEEENWAGLKSGLFYGSRLRLQAARKQFDESRSHLRQAVGVF